MAVQAGQISTQLTADVGNFTSGMRQAQSSFKQTVQTIQTGSSQASGAIDDIAKGVKGLQGTIQRSMALIGAGFILPKMFAKAKSAIIDFNQTLDQSTIAMTHFAGGAEEADKLLNTLQEFAARTPFNFQDLLGTTQQMMAMGVEAKDLLPRLTAIGDAAAGLGGSPEILQRIQRALGQIQAKGRVQAEELMQLAEVGVPAYQYMADVIGSDIPTALDMMRKGQIDSATAISGLLDGLSRDFGGMMESQSKTMMGAMSTVEDFVQMTVASLGRPIFDALRETMLKVADFLSSKEIQEGAERMAKNFAKALKQVGEVVGQILGVVGPVLKDVLSNVYDLGRAIASGMDAAKPAILAVAAGFMALIGAIKIVSAALSPLLGFLAENKTLATVLVSLLGALIIRQKLFGTTTEGAARAGTALIASMKASIAGIKDTIRYQQALANSYGKNLTSMQALRLGTVMGFKAMGVAVKTFMIELLPLLALTAAIVLIVKAFEAYGAKQRVTNERTKELTESIKNQTTALLENREALEAGADGSEILANTLFNTGEESEKLVRAFGALGRAADLQQIQAAAQDFQAYATSVLMSKGATEENAKAMARAIDDTDDNNALDILGQELLFANAEFAGMVTALEQVQDTLENTDFERIAREQGQMLVGTGQLTEAQLLQAQTMTEAMPAYSQMNDETRAIALNQNIMAVATDAARAKIEQEAHAAALLEYQQSRMAESTKKVASGYGRAVDALREMIAATKDGKVSFEDFFAAIMGAMGGIVQFQRSMRTAQKQASSLFDEIAFGEKSFEDLKFAAYDLNDIVLRMVYDAEMLGQSQEQVAISSQAMIQQFVASALQAKYTTGEINGLIDTLNLLDNLDPTITIYTDLSAAQADLKKLAEAMFAVGLAGGNTDELYKRYQMAKAAVDALSKPRTRRGGGGGGRSEKSEDPFAWVEGWISDIASVANRSISEDFINPLITATSAEIKDAFVEIFDSVAELGLDKIPAFKTLIDQIKGKFAELAELADIRDVLTVNLDAATERLSYLRDAFDEVTRAAGQFDSTIVGANAPVTTLLDEALSAQSRYQELLNYSDSLKQQQASLAQSVFNSVFQPITSGNTLGQTRKLLRDATGFRDNLVALRDRGFSADIIAQVAQAGVIEGNKIARSLLSMSGADFAEFVSLRSQIASLGAEAGVIAGNVIFGADIADAESAVTQQHAVVRQLFQDAVAEARANMVQQEQTVTLLTSALDSVTTQIGELVTAIRVDLYDAFAELLAGLPGGLSQLGPMANSASATDTNIIINVEGSVVSEGQLIEKVRLGLLSAQRSGRTVVI